MWGLQSPRLIDMRLTCVQIWWHQQQEIYGIKHEDSAQIHMSLVLASTQILCILMCSSSVISFYWCSQFISLDEVIPYEALDSPLPQTSGLWCFMFLREKEKELPVCSSFLPFLFALPVWHVVACWLIRLVTLTLDAALGEGMAWLLPGILAFWC